MTKPMRDATWFSNSYPRKSGLAAPRRVLGLLFLLPMLLTLVPRARAQQYQLTDLGTLDGNESIGAGINNSGQETGNSGDAFIYGAGQMTDVGSFAASAINGRGQVAGTAGGHAVLFSPATPRSSSTLLDLGTLGGSSSFGYGINGSGQVTGTATTSDGVEHAFLYSNGTMQDLSPVLGGGVSGSIGVGINASGQVAINFDTATAHSTSVYSNGGAHNLGSLGGTFSFAGAINASGQVTGYSNPPGSLTVFHAFLYTPNNMHLGMQDLGTLGGTNSFGQAINASGQVTGYANTSDGVEHAFLYSNGKMSDLNTLDSTSPLAQFVELRSAVGINDNGWIVVNAFDSRMGGEHAYLLTPIPSPSILWQNTTGEVVRWFVNGGTIATSADFGAVPSGWTVQAAADFIGNGNADILWRNTNGDVVIWYTNGDTFASSADLGVIDNSWSIQGTADFNGDGVADILWRNVNGDVVIWFMYANGTISSSADLGVVPSTWTIQRTGDFNGDGTPDILWRNANGDVVVWLMSGPMHAGTIASSADLGVVPSAWTIQGTGDFNGDGKTDILWRNVNGDVVTWFMNGGTIASSADLGVIPGTWTIQGTGYFNSDANTDILWRNANGDVVIWFMNGGTIVSSADLGVISTNWTIQP